MRDSLLVLLAACALASAGELAKIGRLPGESHVGVEFRPFSPEVAWYADRERLWRTVDGGMHWHEVGLPRANDPEGSHFGFIDARSAWFRRLDQLYWTEDAGATWSQPVLLPIPRSSQRRLIYGLAFASRTTGWLLGMRRVHDPKRFDRMVKGRMGFEPGEILVPLMYRTADGGKTWVRQPYPDDENPFGWFVTGGVDHALMIEFNGLTATVGAGRAWKRATLLPGRTGELHSAELGSDQWTGTGADFLADGKNAWWTVEGDLFHSSDGGQTWCQLPPLLHKGKAVAFESMRFADAQEGWVLPEHLGDDDPALIIPYRTHDGGKHWEPFRLAQPPVLCGLSVLDAAHVWMWDCDGTLYRVTR